MKIEDIIMAAASFVVVFVILNLVFNNVFVALIPPAALGKDIAELSSFLVSALIIGYIFAGKIREEVRWVSIGKVVVLAAFAMIFVFMISRAAIGHWNAVTDEILSNTHSTTAWTNTDWYTYEEIALFADAALEALYVLFLGFVGLYLGSMIKPSVRTARL